MSKKIPISKSKFGIWDFVVFGFWIFTQNCYQNTENIHDAGIPDISASNSLHSLWGRNF